MHRCERTQRQRAGHSGQFSAAEEWELTRIRTDLRGREGRARGLLRPRPPDFPTRPSTDMRAGTGGARHPLRRVGSGVGAEERGSHRIGHHRREAGTRQRPRILCGHADAETPAARARVARLVEGINGAVQASETGAAVEGRRGSGGRWRRDGSGGRGTGASESGDALGRVGCFVLLPPSRSHRRTSHQTKPLLALVYFGLDGGASCVSFISLADASWSRSLRRHASDAGKVTRERECACVDR